MNVSVNSLEFGFAKYFIVIASIVFLVTLMGRRDRCKKSAGRATGFVIFMLVMCGFVMFLKVNREAERQPIVERQAATVVEYGEWHSSVDSQFQFDPSEIQFDSDDFIHQARRRSSSINLDGSDILNCQAVFLTPDHNGETLVCLAIDVDPKWELFPVNERGENTSKLLLAKHSSGKYELLGRWEAKGTTNDGQLVYVHPVRLRRGIDPKDLQIRGRIFARLKNDSGVGQLDHDFNATLDRSGFLANLDAANLDSRFGSRDAEASNADTGDARSDDADALAGSGANNSDKLSNNSNSNTNSNTDSDIGSDSSVAATAPNDPAPLNSANPHGDPALVGWDPASGAPAPWLEALDQRVNGTLFSTVHSQEIDVSEDPDLPAADGTSPRQRLLESFQNAVTERIDLYLDQELLEPGASHKIHVPWEFINNEILIASETMTGDESIDPDGKDINITYGRLMFSPEINAKLKDQYREAVVNDRILYFCALAGIFLGVVGVIYAYFRLDTATRGYYSGRLKIAAVVACIFVIGAGSGILDELGRNMF